MIYVKETYPEVFERITSDVRLGEGDDAIVHPVGNLPLYSREELAQLHVIPVEHARLPLDHYEISRGFARVDGVVVEVVSSAPTPLVVPTSVSSAQAAIALDRAGLYDTALAAIISSGNREARHWFERAQTWERNNSYVSSLAALLGLDDTEVDQLFIKAGLVA